MGDWIKIYPKMTEWRWYTDSYAKCIFLHLLLTANYKDKPFLNTTVKRGQVLTSIRHLSEDLNIPEKTVRRKIENLKSTGELVTESTNKWTIITICNYESYQALPKTDDQTNDRADDQTNDQQLKNNRIIDNPPSLSKERVSPLTDRQKKFYDSLLPFIGQYDKKMLREFYDYWSEPNRSKTKMRCELQQTWSLEGRLATWKRKDDERPVSKPQQQSKPTRFEQYKEQAKRLGLFQDDTEQRNSIDEQ